MRLKGRCGDIIIIAIPEQGRYVALVVDLYSLLLLRVRMGAGLEHEPIHGSEDQELPNQGHRIKLALCAIYVVAITSLTNLSWC